MKHDDNEHWWLAEDVKGQVGYAPAAYRMLILDATPREEENVIGDVIQDVTAMSLLSFREPEVDITYAIVEGSSIRERDNLFRSDGFSYTIKRMNGKK